MINPLREIFLRFLAQLKVLDSDLAHKLVVFLELVPRIQIIVVELHASDVGIGGRTDPERGHATPVDIQGAVGEEVEEQPIVWLLGVRDVLGEVVLVAHAVERGRVVDRE